MSYAGTLGPRASTTGGQPRIIKLRDGSGRVLVAKPREPKALVSSITTGVAYRMIGVPAAGAWLAVTTQDVRRTDGQVLIRAGTVLEVNEHLDGDWPDLNDTGNHNLREQLAAQYPDHRATR